MHARVPRNWRSGRSRVESLAGSARCLVPGQGLRALSVFLRRCGGRDGSRQSARRRIVPTISTLD